MKEFPCDRPVSVIIRMTSGNVDVIAEDRATATVDVAPATTAEASRIAAAQTRIEMNGDLLMIETPQQHGLLIRRSAPVNIRLHVPTNSRLQYSAASADIRCDGILSGIDANSASGDVSVDQISGDMQRKAASGDTEFNVVGGDLSVNSASGDVRGGVVGGAMTARSASGDIRIDAVAGSVRAQSASGDIEIERLAAGVARINSASGNVQVAVAEGVSVWLDLSSISGDARSELPMRETAPTGGAAALSLHVRTASGDITVRRSTYRGPMPATPMPPGPPTPPAPPAAPPTASAPSAAPAPAPASSPAAPPGPPSALEPQDIPMAPSA
jgi:hypothetical protein